MTQKLPDYDETLSLPPGKDYIQEEEDGTLSIDAPYGDDITPPLIEHAGVKLQAPSTEWNVGDVILDLYEVQGMTSGGMGTVYFVWHKGWNTKLAMKSLHPELIKSQTAYKRFILEGQTWVEMGHHPYLASCYYVREIEGLPRIFIEYIGGGSLRDWIKQKKVEDWDTILDLAIQFCDGMDYAHKREVIHRDIKPGNCLVTPEGILKVTDFGLVKVGDEDQVLPSENDELMHLNGESMLTMGGMGTPQYMAPEQWHMAREVGPQADVYSFGVMLFEMCCSRRPFEIERGDTV